MEVCTYVATAMNCFYYWCIWFFCAVITTVVQNENYYEKEAASFHCEAAGFPIPEVSWYFKNMKLKFDGKHIISISRPSGFIRSTLLILNLSSFDVGTYICEVTNTAGSATSSGILTVYGKQLNIL